MLRRWLLTRAHDAGWNSPTCRIPWPWRAHMALMDAWRAGYNLREDWYWHDYNAKYSTHWERLARIRAKGYTVRSLLLNPKFRRPHPES